MRSRRRGPLRVAAALALCGAAWSTGLALAGAQVDPATPRVLVTTVDAMIGPVVADHLADGLDRAARDGHAAYVVVLDTPGGLDTSMRAIVQDFLASDVPVIVHVAPRGARAASAGAVLTYAAHVAAMAPGTVIGAATPVGLDGGDIERKVVNDAAAMVESIAELRGRDVGFAVDSVREGRSATAAEALELGVVDLVEADLGDVLDAVDGTEVQLQPGRSVVLETAGAAVDEHEMGLFRRILRVLADPNLAFLFMSIGTLGVIYELASPGIGIGGVLGAVLIILALFGLSVLTVNVVGIVLLVLAVGLFVAELFVPGIGVFAALGAVALVMSGLFLFDDMAGVDVSLGVLVPTAVIVGLATVVAGRLAFRTRHAPATTTGEGLLVGRTLTVEHADGARGQGRTEGAWWTLQAGTPLTEGEEVRVVAVDGIELVVEPVLGTATSRRPPRQPTPDERNRT